MSSFATVFLPWLAVSGLFVRMCTAAVSRITYGVACESTWFGSSAPYSHAPFMRSTGASAGWLALMPSASQLSREKRNESRRVVPTFLSRQLMSAWSNVVGNASR